MSIEILPAGDALGAEVAGVDLNDPIDGDVAALLRRAWLDYWCSSSAARTSTSAGSRLHPPFGQPGGVFSPRPQRGLDGEPLEPGIMMVSNIRRDGKPLGLAHDGEMWFHSDMCYDENPHQATLLYALQIPPKGGNTLFANMYSAYDRLPAATKERIRGRTALQMHEYYRTDRPRVRDDMSDVRHFSHPIAIAHSETGRKALYVNRLMTARIDGMEEAESGALIDELLAASEDPSIVYEHVWQVGDLVMWDNRCVTHARTDFPETERRLLRRTTTEETRPFETLEEYANA